MPSRNRESDNSVRTSLYDKEADERSQRAQRIIALRFVFRRSQSRDDALLLAEALGLDDLLQPALQPREEHHAVS